MLISVIGRSRACFTASQQLCLQEYQCVVVLNKFRVFFHKKTIIIYFGSHNLEVPTMQKAILRK